MSPRCQARQPPPRGPSRTTTRAVPGHQANSTSARSAGCSRAFLPEVTNRTNPAPLVQCPDACWGRTPTRGPLSDAQTRWALRAGNGTRRCRAPHVPTVDPSRGRHPPHVCPRQGRRAPGRSRTSGSPPKQPAPKRSPKEAIRTHPPKPNCRHHALANISLTPSECRHAVPRDICPADGTGIPVSAATMFR